MTYKERDYEWFYFEVRSKRGRLVATFQTRWMAEMFAEKYGCIVNEIAIDQNN